jgi:DNA processing protein
MSRYAYWLANITGITAHQIMCLRQTCSSSQELYELTEKQIRAIPNVEKKTIERLLVSRKNWNIEKEWYHFQEKGIGFVSLEDSAYPHKLSTIVNAPYALYYLGHLPEENKKRVAIVGARTRSAYGSQIADKLAGALAQAGVDVISGMARGIDADGHKGALEAGGKTYAVLGCGVDVCYPRSNEFLYHRISGQGGILSEYPPGTPPLPAYFPQRNRIISGLSDYIVIIEARIKSGSLITADFAMEQGREVYALPGRITDTLSQGCNSLIQQGAGVITSVEEFLKDIQIMDNCPMVQLDFRKNLLEKDELLVYAVLDFYPIGLGTMVEKSNYSLSELLDILERLEHKGFIRETIPNYYIRII